MRREHEITRDYGGSMTLISDSRVHKAYRLYYIDLRGGKQAGMEKEREREREKHWTEKNLLLFLHTYEILIVTDEIGSVQNESRHENWVKDLSKLS